MSAPTVDISNLDTRQLRPNDKTEIYQQQVIKSSQVMFKLAQNSLEQNPGLKKVVIMEHPSRFDTKDVDPTSLKQTLARLANSTLGQMWLNCPIKDKIFIGHHSLEGSGTGVSHESRYVDLKSGHYDGVHFWGQSAREEYTNSVKTIFMMAGLGTAQGTQVRNHNYQSNYQPNMKTKNRFSVFNSNQGNC